jgi:succinate dehydrogenase/fumarate reductase flavoprotein subunit
MTSLRGKPGSLSPLALQRRLQKTMWQKVGLLRDESSLEEALRELEALDHERENAQVPPFESYNTDWLDLLELGSMIRLGKIIARCALERKESRGGHVRMDHPERDDAHWSKTIVASKENGDVAIRTQPIGDVWDDIRPAGLLERLPSSLQELAIRSLPRAAVQRILRKRVASFVAEEPD